ncbi:hypothetical protein [Thermaerobacter subterraneus]|uniref:Uncharacterized protein n=1 Tax=Thermaerobacter subterraneus DSM 13965 TaxID=867903 RepID=K6P3U3_9FIRM|nr:hypothetical protein [Thermaerobacter subterraneus]EKP95720.1 hypothetical protein ThesuDRAFT_01479 [Thermaerobacter subterraneus DSM 13965]
MRVQLTPEAAAFAARELARRPELNYTLTVEAFLVSGCCSPNLPPEVHLGPPPSGDFRAVTVPLAVPGGGPAGPGWESDRGLAPGRGPLPAGDGAAGPVAARAAGAAAGSPQPAVPAAEVYIDPLVDEFVREWYGEGGQEQARRAVLRIDLARYGEREELTVRPWPPRAEEAGEGGVTLAERPVP